MIRHDRLLATLEAYAKFGHNTAATARALKVNKSTVLRHLIRAKRLKIPIPEPEQPKIRVTVVSRSSESGWTGRVLAIGDAHDSPSLDKSRFVWMGRHAHKTRPEKIIQIGDLLTFDSLCRYEGNDTLRGKGKPSFEEDIQSGHEALKAFNSGLDGYDCDRHITIGNHEDRAMSFTNRTPEVAGMLTGLIDNLFMSHGWTYSPYGLIHYVGSVGFVHAPLNRLAKPYGGKTAKNQIANDTLHDIVYGHDHMGGEVVAQKIGANQSVTVLNLGCALPHGHVEAYVGHGMSGWRYGVYDLTVRDGRLAGSSFVSMLELERLYA